MGGLWQPGDVVALRSLFVGRIRSAQAAIVVKDTAEETVLLVTPGARGAVPERYLRRMEQDYTPKPNWEEFRNGTWVLKPYVWQSHRFLWFFEPEKYYAMAYGWQEETDWFWGYYVNFQLPYRRSHCGFDSLDLELDIVLNPQLQWRWKDKDLYQERIREGLIDAPSIEGIERAKGEVFAKIRERQYPFDGSWSDWRPNPSWTPPRLPARWDEL